MPPRLTSEDGRNVVIRPLAYVAEAQTKAFSAERRYPTVRCGCLSCGLPDQKRQVIKRMLTELEKQNPGVKLQMLAALRNVKAGHLLDTNLWERLGLSANLKSPGVDHQDPDTDEVPV